MYKRLLAMLLAGAICVTLCLAADADSPLLAPITLVPNEALTAPVQADTPSGTDSGTQDTAREPAAESESALQTEAPAPNGILPAPANQAANTPTQTTGNAAGQNVTIGFTGIDRTVRQNNLTIKANDQTLSGIETVDWDAQELLLEWGLDDMEKLLQSYDDAISALKGSATDDNEAMVEAMIKSLSSMKASAEINVSSMKKQLDNFDDTKDDAKTGYATAKKQFQGVADQLVMGAESLYISLHALELQQGDLQRSLAALDRTTTEMQKRYELGQISEIQLLQVKNQRSTLAATIESLKIQTKGLKSDLAILMGYDPTVVVSLSTMPSAAGSQNYDADLKEAIKNSYTLYLKNEDMRKASNDYERDVTSTVHNYDAAKIAYQAAEVQLVGSFRKLYDATVDKQRLYDLAKDTEELQQRLYETASTKMNRGMISQNTFQNAKDEYVAAQSATKKAEIELFTAVNQYNWAKKGVMG